MTEAEKPQKNLENPPFEIKKGNEVKTRKIGHRKVFYDILNYVNSESTKQVCALCGVLHSGKTTLIKQLIEHLEPEQKEKSLFITCKPESKFTDLYLYICEKIEKENYKYFFIDEITYLEDFSYTQGLLNHLVKKYDVRFVITGTNFFRLIHSSVRIEELDNEKDFLILNTTFISFSDYDFLNKNYKKHFDFLNYVKSGYLLNSEIFSSYKKMENYIQKAIISNIYDSLDSFNLEKKTPTLAESYDKETFSKSVFMLIDDFSYDVIQTALENLFNAKKISSFIIPNRDLNYPIKDYELEKLKRYFSQIGLVKEYEISKDNFKEIFCIPGLLLKNCQKLIEQYFYNTEYFSELQNEIEQIIVEQARILNYETGAYSDVFFEEMEETFSDMMWVGTEKLKFDVQEFFEKFLKSYFNSKCFISGLFGINQRSGSEIALEISGLSYEEQNAIDLFTTKDDIQKFQNSDLVKCSNIFIYYQWRTCRSFNEINSVISFEDFFELYKSNKDLSKDDFCKMIEQRFAKRIF